MQNLLTENRKLPAWIGSILFHAVLAFLLMCWLSFAPSPKSAPGERTAVGSIVFQAPSQVQADFIEPSEPSSAGSGSPSPDADGGAVGLEKFSDVALDVFSSIPLLAPGQDAVPPVTLESADGFKRSFGGSGGSGSIGTGKGGTTVQFFGTEGKGTKFMYVFDRSASMDGMPIRRAKEELIQSFDSLNEFHQFNIVFYNGEWQLWQPGRKLVFATPTEKEHAIRFISGITASGGTRHFEPLREAIAHRPDVIFFLTDGETQDDRTLQLPELEQANSRWGFGAQINVIQFGRGGLTDPPSKLLQQLAEQNHGQYQYFNITTLK